MKRIGIAAILLFVLAVGIGAFQTQTPWIYGYMGSQQWMRLGTGLKLTKPAGSMSYYLDTDIPDISGLYEHANVNIQAHIARTDNPHATSAAQLGLGLVSNTADADKPVSTQQQAALDLKPGATTSGGATNIAGLFASLLAKGSGTYCFQVDGAGNLSVTSAGCPGSGGGGIGTVLTGAGLKGDGSADHPLGVDTDSVPAQHTYTATLTFPPITKTPPCLAQPIPFPGAVVGDVVDLGLPPNIDPGVVPYGFVASKDVVLVRLCNVTVSSTVTQGVGPWRASIVRAW